MKGQAARLRLGIIRYIAEVQRRGVQARASDDIVRHTVLSGLRPDIKAIVMQHEAATLAEVARWGRIAEGIAVTTQPDIKTVVAQAIKEALEANKPLQPMSFNNSGVRFGNRSGQRGGGHSGWPGQPTQRFASSNPRGRGFVGPRGGQPRWMTQGPYQNDRGVQRQFAPVREWTCYYCGLSHPQGTCPAYGRSCASCGRLNHFSRCCQSTGVSGGAANQQ